MDAGGSPVPQDFNVWGHNAGWQPQPCAVAQEIRSGLESAAELALGVAEGLGEVLVGAAKFAVLNAVTLFGYGTYSLGKSLWDGYKEDGILGALNAVNPLYQIALGSVTTYKAAEAGDYRAAGARGAVTAVATVGVVATVAGAGGVAAGAGRGASTARASGGAVARDVVVPSRRFPETATHIRDAQAAGHPSVLTIARPGAEANRAAAQAGHTRVPGTQLDEYPPAMFREGGAGASIRAVSPSDNMGRELASVTNASAFLTGPEYELSWSQACRCSWARTGAPRRSGAVASRSARHDCSTGVAPARLRHQNGRTMSFGARVAGVQRARLRRARLPFLAVR